MQRSARAVAWAELGVESGKHGLGRAIATRDEGRGESAGGTGGCRGKAGFSARRLEVETWGLKVTLRDGLGGLVEVGKSERRREVASEAAEAIMRSVRWEMGCGRPGVTVWVVTASN